MNIGLYLKWNKGSLNNNKGNVLGDELYAESLVKALLDTNGVTSADVYAPNYIPKLKLDVMIYLNDTLPIEGVAHRHVLYMQNAYGDGSDVQLKSFQKIGYDGYIFISNTLLSMHRELGCSGIYLPFGVDTSIFYPRKKQENYMFDVAYIGNDIKGKKRTEKYLLPAVKYNFGLFGNWKIPKARFRIWKNLKKHDAYKYVFKKISKGRIDQEDVPILYSSTKINLNCTAQDCVDWDVITLRVYEVLACKGFLITDRVPLAEKNLHDCVVFTDGGKDLEEKIEFYLNKPNAREQFSENGYQYVLEKASISARAKELYKYLESIV